MTAIIATPELVGALTSGFDDKANKAFTDDPAKFATAVGIKSDIEIKTVQNSDDTLNLALPFYSSVTKAAGEALSDDYLEAASGGNSGYYYLMAPSYSHQQRREAAELVVLGGNKDQRIEAFELLQEWGYIKM